ncbi:MAG: putative alpha/beta hydrolase [Pseudonocardiales bacterium]|nr:putative alpha/beta hydrolase [Jatrophihabitantaceae bacterium]MCW2602996.1 putative alpha/beta hydrolase [Pseudonocardiales bacterium]
MAELLIEGNELVLRLSTFEKAAALHRDLRLPVSAIGSVEVTDKPFTLVKGLKAAGLSIPRRVAIGTFRGRGGTRFFVLKGSKPAVHITFTRGSIAALVISAADADALAERVQTASGR